MSILDFINLLRLNGYKPQQSGSSWMALCPAHKEKTPSLHISQAKDGRILVHCFGGICPAKEICFALGLEVRALMPGVNGIQTGSSTHQSYPVIPPKDRKPLWDAPVLISRWQRSTDPSQIASHAHDLGVKADALMTLGVCWASEHRAWAFPMHDGQGGIVGIRLRNEEGRKWAVVGSKTGIFLPALEPQDVMVVCEGPTDTAAALSVGFWAVGRPDCNGGIHAIEATCLRFRIEHVVIIADNDAHGRGLKGAYKLAAALTPLCRIWTPPAKDMREMISGGIDKSTIEAAFSSQQWKRYKL